MNSEKHDAIRAYLRDRAAAFPSGIPEMRRAFDDMLAALPVLPGTVTTPLRVGDLRAAMFAAPGVANQGVLLFLHGGGYAMGSVKGYAGFVSRAGKAAGLPCLAIDYRLAPEHPCPAAIDDAEAAYQWLLDHGYDPARIAVFGDSAGGGLAIALLLQLRDIGAPLPAFAACISPWTDLALGGASLEANAEREPFLRIQAMRGLARLYLGGRDPRDPAASPLHASLAGLPPILIAAGSAEMLLDDARGLAEKARQAGVAAELALWEDMFHGWHLFPGALPEAEELLGLLGARVRAALELDQT